MAKVKAICFNSVILPAVNLLLMKNTEAMFSEFPSISKEEWLAKIEKDLKGQPLEELDWAPEEGIRVSPFSHFEDREKSAATGDSRDQNHWEIGQYITVTDPKTANISVPDINPN